MPPPSTPNSSSSTTYTIPPLPIFSSLLGYTESGRIHDTSLRSTAICQKLNIDPTPAELTTLNYYNSIPYIYDARFSRVAAINSIVYVSIATKWCRPRPRPPSNSPGRIGIIMRALAKASPKTASVITVGSRMLFLVVAGGYLARGAGRLMLWGGLESIRRQDPVLVRFYIAEDRQCWLNEHRMGAAGQLGGDDGMDSGVGDWTFPGVDAKGVQKDGGV